MRTINTETRLLPKWILRKEVFTLDDRSYLQIPALRSMHLSSTESMVFNVQWFASKTRYRFWKCMSEENAG